MSTFVPPIQAAIKRVKGEEGDLVNNAARELARQMADKIAKSEPIVADLVEHGKTRVVPAYYDLHSGKVSILESL
jgi:carbonic anhydrase